MRLTILLFLCLTTAGFGGPADKKSTSTPQKKSQPQSSNRQSQQTITGCVDEQDGSYVLLDDQMQNKLAALEAVGASNEAFFAKHLGHTVVVKGRMSSEPDSKFRVSSIEDKAPVCGPAQSPNPQ